MKFFYTFLTIVATAAIAAGQTDQKMGVGLAASMHATRQNMLAPRSLSPGSAVCVNPPLNLTGREIDTSLAARELARQIREAGFPSAPLGMLASCDATVYTEVVSVAGRNRKNVELEFRIILLGEQIPRLCSSVHSRSASWQDALVEAFAGEARQIRDAQQKGMAIYPGAVE
jgi:hypothetical protein